MQMVIACCLILSLFAASAQGSLLTNGDFEARSPRDGEIPSWQLSKDAELQRVWIDSMNTRSGQGALAIRSIRTTKAPSVISQRVPVEPNASYALSLWAKRDSFVYGTKFSVVLSKGGQEIDRQSKQFRGTDWFPVCMGFDAGEADTAEVQLTTPNTGTWRITVGRTLWVDDVQLVKIDAGDNIVRQAEAAVDKRGCATVSTANARGRSCLYVNGREEARFAFDIAPTKAGVYYVWMRARCPGRNEFSIRTVGGRAWRFRSHTPSKSWRWVRPVLPELLIESGTQRMEFTAQGEEILIDQIIATMDPFWRPEGAPRFMSAIEAAGAARKRGLHPARRGALALSILGDEQTRPWEETQWPVSQGVPFPRGTLAEPERVRVVDEAGISMPCQTSPFTQWPDGSIKWLLVSTFAPKGSRCRLEYGTEIRQPSERSRLRMSESADGIDVDTGKLKLRVASDGSPLIRGVWIDRRGDGDYEQVVAKGVLRANRVFLSTGDKPEVTVEERGPVRATIKVAGQYVHEGSALLDYVLRISAYDGCDFLTMEHTFLRRRGALKIPLSDMALVFDLVPSARLETFTWQSEGGPRSCKLAGQTATLVSKVTSNTKRQNDYPFSVRVGAKEMVKGVRYPGTVSASGAGRELGACVRHFWQNSPKSFAVSPRRLEIGLIAAGETVEFYKGMAKTHEIMLHFGADTKPLDCFAVKPLLAASPEWYCKTRAFDAFPAPRRSGEHAYYERCIDNTLAKWCNTIDVTTFRQGCGGMIHVGDFGGKGKFMNLESALGEGFMVQFFRTGSRAAFDQADLSLSHFSDIDIDHSDDAAGLIYVHATHGRKLRSPESEGINGHSWFNGTTYYGLFIGSRRILEQAAEVGRYYSNYEFSLQPYIHYWRKIAWKFMDLMCAYDLTGDMQFLEAARKDVIVTGHQRDHVVTLWPYMCGVGLKALRHYCDATGDLEARELYLQMMDGFLHLRQRPNDTVNGEHLKRPGMLFGNFPNDRSCAFYNELAHAYFMTGDARYARLGASDLNWQVRFNVNDPTLMWGSSDLVTAMRWLDIPGPAVAQTLPGVFMTERAEPSPLVPPQTRPTITFQVTEDTDQSFTVHLFKGCYRKYTAAYHGVAKLYDPDGEMAAQQPVSTEGLQEFTFAVPKDGKTGVYTLQVVLDDIWRWTVTDASFDLTPGTHVLTVAPRYSRLWFDRFMLVPDAAYFPWLDETPPHDAIVLEAESAPLAKGYEILMHPDASGGRCVRRAVRHKNEAMRYDFSVPPHQGARRFRLFARIWKPYADLLNVRMDDQPAMLIQQTHDMDGNVYPVWAIGTSLGEDAVVRYWERVIPGKPSRYSAKYLKPAKAFDRH